MRILHVLEPLMYGGVEKMVLFLTQYLTENKHEVHIATPSKMMGNIEEKYHDMAVIHELKYHNPYNVIGACSSLAKVFKHISPDVIHTHARRPTVYTCLINKEIPHVRTYHMEEFERLPKFKFEYELMKKRVNGWAVTWNGIIEKELKHVDNNTPVHIIPNGVPEISVQKHSNTNGNIHMLFVGRLSYQKGLEILIDGISQLSSIKLEKVKLTVVGDGDLRQSLEKQVEDLGLKEVVKFVGFHDDLAPFYIMADLLVMPSRYEGLPLTMIESMSAATPVAATCVGAIPSIIKDDVNGWLIRENNSKCWTEVLDNIITTGILTEMGKSAKETYNESFRVEKMCKNYLKLYGDVIRFP